jgi:hypothetical protein
VDVPFDNAGSASDHSEYASADGDADGAGPAETSAAEAEEPAASSTEVSEPSDPALVAARLERAEALKKEGNEAFGRGEWDAAAFKYHEALDKGGACPPQQWEARNQKPHARPQRHRLRRAHMA